MEEQTFAAVCCVYFPEIKRISIGLKMGAASELAFAVFLISLSSGGWISVGKITGMYGCVRNTVHSR